MVEYFLACIRPRIPFYTTHTHTERERQRQKHRERQTEKETERERQREKTILRSHSKQKNQEHERIYKLNIEQFSAPVAEFPFKHSKEERWGIILEKLQGQSSINRKGEHLKDISIWAYKGTNMTLKHKGKQFSPQIQNQQ